jgi:hypothetical protein
MAIAVRVSNTTRVGHVVTNRQSAAETDVEVCRIVLD